MAKAGFRKIAKYGDRFKATAVKLSSLPGVQIKDVAAALDIHPFMLSLWRRQVRERVIVAMTYLIGVSGAAHIVAGSIEAFMLLASGELGIGAMLGGFMLPVLAGNIIGGTALFALLSYAQVMKEI